MFSRTRLRLTLAVLASVSLGGCTIYADGSSDNLIEPDATGQCVRDTIAQCYLDQLPADTCAELVLSTCDLDEPTPTDPQCFDEVLRDCLVAGGDPMTCELRASEACNQPDPNGDCFDRVFDECMTMYADPQVCTVNAEQVCYGTGCDPADPMCQPQPCTPGDPTCNGDPDCFDRVFRDCLVQGGDPMTCSDQAAQVCSGQPPCLPGDPSCPPPPCDPNDPMCQPPPPCDPNDPMCQPPPPCDPADPTCGGPSCTEQVFRDCLAQGIDPMTCAQLAAEACNEPPPPCAPGDPSCPPPPCDPSDPMCQPPPPPCDPADPMCSYP